MSREKQIREELIGKLNNHDNTYTVTAELMDDIIAQLVELDEVRKLNGRYFNLLEQCPLCKKRKVENMHHFVPRSRGGAKDEKSMWGKRKVKLCRPCHFAIHKVLTDTELEINYRSLDEFFKRTQILKKIMNVADVHAGSTM